MKTTINLGANKRIVTSPIATGAGCIMVEIQARDAFTQEWETRLPLVLEENQAGAFIFGIEQAFDAMAMQARASLQRVGAAA